jgi:hypothetical protein
MTSPLIKDSWRELSRNPLLLGGLAVAVAARLAFWLAIKRRLGGRPNHPGLSA